MTPTVAVGGIVTPLASTARPMPSVAMTSIVSMCL